MTVDLAPTRRERKKQATRHAIHKAAMELAEERGLHGVTVEAISERADVAPRTFWAYFRSKEDAVLGTDHERPEALRAALLARPAGEDAFTALRQVIVTDILNRCADTEQSLRRFALVRREPALLEAMAANHEEINRSLVAAVAERRGEDPKEDLYPTLVVSAGMAALKAAQMVWTDRRGKHSLEALLADAFDQVAAGLASPRATTRRTR